ncbi:hypothetical protein [Achromobacter mucicolens]|uniref:hypothetical protein n=1 Tax=Achromobacter mucicolens TaxID=1389922 RepID=UPI0022F4004F|nr:hypothetical protein [Achromobacter mucicolens]WBX91313.1 hypothetical protein PE062_11915 [Achromobacter mucicolens]
MDTLFWRSKICVRQLVVTCKLMCVLVPCLGLVSCFSSEKGFVSSEWQSNFAELGIYPKFPAEEDLKVGDVYLIPRSKSVVIVRDGDGEVIQQLRLGTMLGNVISPEEVTDFHAARYSYEGSEPVSLPPSADSAQVVAVVPQAMRRVAMPEFFRLEVAGADAAALLPSGWAALQAGLTWSNVRSASVTVDDVSSTSVPLALALAALVDVNGNLAWKTLGFSSSTQGMRWLQSVQSGYKDGKAEIFLITKVYYARVFNIDIYGSTGISSGAATPQFGGNDGQRFAPVGYSIATRYEEKGRIGLSKIYDRYVAIGYRGARLRLSTDGKITKIESLSWGGSDAGVALENKGG